MVFLQPFGSLFPKDLSIPRFLLAAGNNALLPVSRCSCHVREFWIFAPKILQLFLLVMISGCPCLFIMSSVGGFPTVLARFCIIIHSVVFVFSTLIIKSLLFRYSPILFRFSVSFDWLILLSLLEVL